MTIKDIARESGYSVGTVSRVLNNSAGVSEKAKERVLEIVKKYDFHLNTNAKLLKQQTRAGIGIIIKGNQNMLFASIVEQVQGLMKKAPYDCLIFYIEEDENEVEMALTLCRERHVLGIMFLGSNKEFFQKSFAQVEVPCVLVTNSAQGVEFPNLSSVTTDDEKGALSVVEYLIEMGHKDIGIIGGDPLRSEASAVRLKGCEAAFAAHNMKINMDRQYSQAHFSITEGYRAMEDLLGKMPEMTALFAMSDTQAIGAIRAAFDRGLRVPEDVSVIGYDGIEIGRYMYPRLTTVRQNKESIARKSIEILLRAIEEGTAPSYEVEPFHLMPGESVMRFR